MNKKVCAFLISSMMLLSSGIQTFAMENTVESVNDDSAFIVMPYMEYITKSTASLSISNQGEASVTYCVYGN